MLEESKETSGQPDVIVGDGTQETITQQPKKDSVSYDSHRKLLGEKKKFQAELQEKSERLEKLEQERMEAEGKKDELIQMYKRKLEETEGKLKSAVGNFATHSVSSKFTEEALKQGCIDTELLLAITDVKSFDYDDNFNPDAEQIRMMVEDYKKNKPHLFQKAVPNIKDGIPKGPEAPTSYEDELKRCTTQKQLDEVMRKHGRI